MRRRDEILDATARVLVASGWDGLTTNNTSGLNYLNNSGITGTLVFVAIGVVIYVVMRFVNRSSGVDQKMLFAEIPPD